MLKLKSIGIDTYRDNTAFLAPLLADALSGEL